MPNTMNFQAYLENTYRIIKEEPVILILGGLLVQLLTVFSLGILAGPLVGGYTLLVILYLRDNRKPTFKDIFSGLQQFANLFPYFLVLILIFLGFMLLILPGLLFATWWIYVLPLMVDKKISFSDAMRLSMNKVNEKGFLMHLVFLLLISVIPMLLIDFVSTMIPFLFVVKILLPPFQVGCLASLYIDQFKQEEATVDSTPDDELNTETAVLSSTNTEKESDTEANEEENKADESGTPDMKTSEEKTRNDSEEK
ncbi:hypothetical protein ACFLZQ_00265 [Thermodesulfobacteriota bacterium]